MISFFFATMVALTMNATTTIQRPNDIQPITELKEVYEDNKLVAYRYGGLDDEYDDYNNEIWSPSNNIMNFHLDLGLEYDIGFQIQSSVYGYNTASCVGNFKVAVLGESVSTNIYLTNIYVYTSPSNVINLGHSIYFSGQNNFYEDGESGNFDFDLPNSSFGGIFISFEIRAWDVQSQEGQWYNKGYNDGYNAGNTEGHDTGYNEGYSIGYTDGYNQGFHTDATVTSIFSGILQVALVPINFFLAIFNFEILGINLSGFIRALFTIAITIIIIRTIFGGKGASDL